MDNFFFNIISIFVVLFSMGYALFISHRDMMRNPVFYFTAFQMINFLGTLPLLDYSNPIDRTYFFVYVVATLSMTIGFIIGDHLFPVSISTIKSWERQPIVIETGVVYTGFVYMLLIVSMAISALYFVMVGYNVFLLGVVNIISGGGVVQDVSTLRLASYNSAVSGKYFYPGYVNQFKDTLLPLTLFYLWGKRSVLRVRSRWWKIERIVLVTLSLFAIPLILGTGQRGAFVLAILQGGAFLMILAKKRLRRKMVVLGSSLLLAFLTLSTFLIGRAGEGEFDLLNVLGAIWYRIASANQWGAVIGFREILYHEAPQWGMEWYRSLIGLLPGVKGSMLSNRIARRIWGGYGTTPPSNWGAVFYDFKWIGLVVIPIMFSLILKYLYMRMYRRRKEAFRLLIYASGFVIISTWIAGNPMNYYFNVGLVALIVLRFLFRTLEVLIGARKMVRLHSLPGSVK